MTAQGRTPQEVDSHITELVVKAIALLLIAAWLWELVA